MQENRPGKADDEVSSVAAAGAANAPDASETPLADDNDNQLVPGSSTVTEATEGQQLHTTETQESARGATSNADAYSAAEEDRSQPDSAYAPHKTVPSWGEKLARMRETNLAWQLSGLAFNAAALLSVVVAALSFASDTNARREERQRIALQQLTQPGAGDRGRGAQLNYLVSTGWDLSGYDFSCLALGVWKPDNLQATRQSDDPLGQCEGRVVFRGLGDPFAGRRPHDGFWTQVLMLLDVTGPPNGRGDFSGHTEDIDLSSATIERAKLDGQSLSWASLHNARVSESSFVGTFMGVGDLCFADFYSTDFTGATVNHVRPTTGIRSSNVSNALLLPQPESASEVEGSRAWADMPPRQELDNKWYVMESCHHPPMVPEGGSGGGSSGGGTGGLGGDARAREIAEYNADLPPAPLSFLQMIEFCSPVFDGLTLAFENRPNLLRLSDEECVKVPADVVWENVISAMEARTDLDPELAAEVKTWRSLK